MPLKLKPIAGALERRVKVNCAQFHTVENHSGGFVHRRPATHREAGCTGTRTIPDPALDKLRAIVWAECYGYFYDGPQPAGHFAPPRICNDCGWVDKDGGYSHKALRTAYWIAAGEGALAGALLHALSQIPIGDSMGLAMTITQEQEFIYQVLTVGTDYKGVVVNPDQAALDAVTQAVKEMK